MDFRGRVYPIPAHLNHMGSDLGRGVLTFAQARPLGVRGFFWLQIHLANLAGFDKASHQERLDYVKTNAQVFMDSALKPLTGDVHFHTISLFRSSHVESMDGEG